MKKGVKIILAIIVVLILCWLAMFSIDYNRVTNLEMPIFVIGIDTADDGGTGTYYGLGYKVEVVKNISAEYGVQIQETEMYMFGKVIAGAIADYSNSNNNEGENNSEYYFYATVIESDTTYILVEPDEGEDIRRSADQISISLGKDNDMIYPVGMRIKVTYTGEIMESYPAQVSAIDIEIVSLDFELDVVENDIMANLVINESLGKSI